MTNRRRRGSSFAAHSAPKDDERPVIAPPTTAVVVVDTVAPLPAPIKETDEQALSLVDDEELVRLHRGAHSGSAAAQALGDFAARDSMLAIAQRLRVEVSRRAEVKNA